MAINPNSDRDYINGYCLKSLQDQVRMYPQLFSGIEFDTFRHIRDLKVEFNSPITVISGSNKSGKTSILLAIACSHYNFLKRDYSNGTFKRFTWGQIMRFTNHDEQQLDWTYHVTYRIGNKSERKRGQRKYATKKWNGVAKKESQIGTPVNGRNVGRKVYFIDLDRIIPARKLSSATFKNARNNNNINPLQNIVTEYVSYILEREYNVGLLYANADSEVFGYESAGYKYSSYNTASGEDVLTKIIEDIVNAEEGSLILIEEIEIGLHPKIQRRLIDVIYYESRRAHKQFIVTTHSPNVLASVSPLSRVFIENTNNVFRAIPKISINAALTKMDSLSYPLVDIYVEDDISKNMVQKAIESINENRHGFNRIVNIVIIGDADKTYNYFKTRAQLYNKETVNTGYACVLDGDMRIQRSNNGLLKYPQEDLLFFHYSNEAPEKMLLKAYLDTNPNDELLYHYNNSNPHRLFEKMKDTGVCMDQKCAFELCWNALIGTPEGQSYFSDLKNFIINSCKNFSNDL